LKDILKWPLVVAAFVVVSRVIVERAGAPTMVSNLFSAAVLITALGPIYFAVRIGMAGKARPYWILIKLVVIYAACTRAMVLPTYWLARVFHWQERRFGGLAEPNPFVGFIELPLFTAAFWILASLVVGGAIGSAVLTVVRLSRRATLEEEK
jgi:hypothetical protein